MVVALLVVEVETVTAVDGLLTKVEVVDPDALGKNEMALPVMVYPPDIEVVDLVDPLVEVEEVEVTHLP